MGIDQLIRDVQPRNTFSYRPGKVGSVGDVVVKTRFRQSTPEMPWAYDPYWQGDRANKLGSNVQDGDTLGYDNGGGPARTLDERWVGDRSFKHQYGFEFHDVQSPDKRTEPWVASLGDFSWRHKIGTFRHAKVIGHLFSVKPQGYQPEPNDLLRGGNSVRVTDTLGGDENGPQTDIITGDQMDNQPVTNNPGMNEVNAGVSRLGLQKGHVYTGSRYNPSVQGPVAHNEYDGENSLYHPVHGARRRLSQLNLQSDTSMRGSSIRSTSRSRTFRSRSAASMRSR